MSSHEYPPTHETKFEGSLAARHRPAHARRTADTHAAFVLPHLRPGLRLLDCGCGPASITAGLARAIAPGLAVGIDLSIDAPGVSRKTVLEDASKLHLCTADATRLPFAAGSFDVVFAHALLQHLPDPLAAVREMRRVLKRGGVIALADADYDGSIIAPRDPLLDASMDLIARLRLRRGRGNARIGKHLRELLHDAGFERIEASARAGAYGTETRVRETGVFWASYFESEELAQQLTDAGLATRGELHEMCAAWRRWSSHPGAFWATFWCEAIGRKPGGDGH